MSKNDLRMCCVCHKEYSFCPVCNPEDRLKPTWHFAYCSENCKDIYNITSSFENGRLSDIDAKAKLEKLDLNEKDNFGESYQKSIDSIMKAKPQLLQKKIKRQRLNLSKKIFLQKSKTRLKVMLNSDF